MKHSRFIAWCLSSPWALMPERMAAYARVLAAHATGAELAAVDKIARDDLGPGLLALDDDGSPVQAAAAASSRNRARAGAIAVVPIYGTIVQRASQLDMCEQGTSTQQISAALADAMADDSVSQILLDIDSPGGSVYGVQELAAEIAGSKKPIIALSNSLAASAAYWLGSAASEFYCTPGGEVGSIGVWMAHQDWSAALEADGVKMTLISAGEFKVEGNPYQPLGTEAQKFMQSRVDDYYAAFTRGVAKGRKVSVEQVRQGMGQGRCYGADQAKAERMIDGIMTLDQVIRMMQKNIANTTQRQASRLAAARRELDILG